MAKNHSMIDGKSYKDKPIFSNSSMEQIMRASVSRSYCQELTVLHNIYQKSFRVNVNQFSAHLWTIVSDITLICKYHQI